MSASTASRYAFGVGTTVKSVALVAVPPAVVTRMRPVVAPDGTVAVIRVGEVTENWVAATLLKLTSDGAR